jgi:hypothetical protein
MTGGWRKIHNEEFHNWYSSPEIRVIKSRINGTRVANEKCIQPLRWKLQKEEKIWGTRYRLGDNIKMGVNDMACECLNWINLNQNWDVWRFI